MHLGRQNARRGCEVGPRILGREDSRSGSEEARILHSAQLQLLLLRPPPLEAVRPWFLRRSRARARSLELLVWRSKDLDCSCRQRLGALLLHLAVLRHRR